MTQLIGTDTELKEGDRIFILSPDDGVTRTYGTIYKSKPEEFYPWSVKWDDGLDLFLVLGLLPIWKV